MYKSFYLFIFGTFFFTGCCDKTNESRLLSEDLLYAQKDTVIADSIIYHPVRLDENGNILPWYSSSLGESYNDAIMRVWKFWKNLEKDVNGLPYYLNHQVWRPIMTGAGWEGPVADGFEFVEPAVRLYRGHVYPGEYEIYCRLLPRPFSVVSGLCVAVSSLPV